MKTYIFLVDGVEEVEAVATMDVLRRAEIDVTSVSITNSKRIVGAHNITIEADSLLDDNDYSTADCLIIPGGTIKYAENTKMKNIVAKHCNEGKLTAAICAAPSVLGMLGLLNGKEAVCYPGFEQYLSGATIITNQRVVKSSNIITAKGPACAIEFGMKIAEVLKNKDVADEVGEAMIV